MTVSVEVTLAWGGALAFAVQLYAFELTTHGSAFVPAAELLGVLTPLQPEVPLRSGNATEATPVWSVALAWRVKLPTAELAK